MSARILGGSTKEKEMKVRERVKERETDGSGEENERRYDILPILLVWVFLLITESNVSPFGISRICDNHSVIAERK